MDREWFWEQMDNNEHQVVKIFFNTLFPKFGDKDFV